MGNPYIQGQLHCAAHARPVLLTAVAEERSCHLYSLPEVAKGEVGGGRDFYFRGLAQGFRKP